jgi:hypothetical protein
MIVSKPPTDLKLIAPDEDPVFGRINRLLAVIREDDERGLVLSIGAFAEECLGRLLLTYLRGGKSASDLVDGFNAPLGTLSARIKACHALGLLTEEQYRDLESMRRVRNEFAHNWEGCAFEQQNIAAWIASMQESRLASQPAATPREKFRDNVAHILVELEYLRSTLGPGQRQAPVVATHLSPHPPAVGQPVPPTP